MDQVTLYDRSSSDAAEALLIVVVGGGGVRVVVIVGLTLNPSAMATTRWTRCGVQWVNPIYTKRCEEKHSNTTAHHPVVKPPAAASRAV